ncbi:MAG: type II toxin-antitoxin system VapC family toxin [bacterium]|nr:type II toxin-antitoxin system VapC family toxin [bacterium]
MMTTDPMFVDTNLFLRYLTNDMPERADAVEELLQKAAAGDVGLVTNSLVMADIVWTLESFYQLEREEIRKKIVAIFILLSFQNFFSSDGRHLWAWRNKSL